MNDKIKLSIIFMCSILFIVISLYFKNEDRGKRFPASTNESIPRENMTSVDTPQYIIEERTNKHSDSY
ncbi:hypothetical protein A9Q84_18175 [Halobacteriovorax marinus]|uniref:Uncharacterized protein n=1 Tax=Halobacteriovorax marinus TaxID=97084 RepID=A0A1Y5F9X6_9BACT|nr:hypothetical protein A9Q84_18175 [Halobacteriovorax marinus]